MLGWIQRHKSKALGTMLIGGCALLMLTFGTNSMFGSGQMQYAATVDDTNISFIDFERQRQAIEQRHRQTFGEQFENYRRFLNINQEALESSINEVLLSSIIEELGLTTSLAIIEQQITSSPFFQGSFSPEKFNAYKQALRMSGAQIQDLFRRETIRQQFVNLLKDTSYTSETELKAIFDSEETTHSFRFVSFEPSTYLESVEVEEEALKQYFEENAENYRKPRTVSYEFVQFDPKDFAAKVDVQEVDLRYLYDDRKSEFTKPAEVNLSWIKIEKKTEALSKLEELVLSEDEIQQNTDTSRQDADALLAFLDDGADFAEIATKSSQDEESAKNGGNIGWKTYEQIEPEISRAVRLLEPGDYTNVIDTDSGYYIVKLEDQKDASFQEFDEAKATLEEQFRKEEAPAYAYVAAEKFYGSIQTVSTEKISLHDKALAENLSVISTEGFVSENENPVGVPQGLTKEIIDLASGDTELVELKDKTVVVSMLEEKASLIPELEEVREKVTSDFKNKLAEDMAKKKAEEFLAQLTEVKDNWNSTTFAEAAATAGLTITETDAVTSKGASSSSQPFLSNAETKSKLFKLQTANTLNKELLTVANKQYVVELAEIKKPDAAAFAEKEAEIKTQEEQQQVSRVFNSLISTLKAKAEIWTNPSVTEQTPANVF